MDPVSVADGDSTTVEDPAVAGTTAVHDSSVGGGSDEAGLSAEETHAGEPMTLRRFATLSSRAAALYVASRVGVLLIGSAVASVTHQTLGQSLEVWDSRWYISIAQGGYVSSIPPGSGNPAQCNLGFFPLLPLVIRFVHLVTRFGYPVSGLVASTALGFLAAIAVWWMLRDLFGADGADRGTAMVVFAPGALVFSFVYTEGATVLLVACTLLALRRHRWLLAGLCAGAASAADPVASAVVVPCVVAAVIAIRRDREYRSLLAPILSPAGIGLFFIYLWAHTGSPLEWFHAQRAGWQGGTYGNGVPGSLYHLVMYGFGDPNYGVKGICALASVGLLVVFFRARPPATWIGYVVAVLAYGAISPIIGVSPRLLLRCFPLVAVFGARLPRFWFEVALGLSALCMAALSVMAMGGPLWTP